MIFFYLDGDGGDSMGAGSDSLSSTGLTAGALGGNKEEKGERVERDTHTFYTAGHYAEELGSAFVRQ